MVADLSAGLDLGRSVLTTPLPVRANLSSRSIAWPLTKGKRKQCSRPFDAGTYRFTLLADDGVRLWVDDRLLIDLQFVTDSSLISLSSSNTLARAWSRAAWVRR